MSNNSELLHVIKGKLISFQSFGQDLLVLNYIIGYPIEEGSSDSDI